MSNSCDVDYKKAIRHPFGYILYVISDIFSNKSYEDYVIYTLIWIIFWPVYISIFATAGIVIGIITVIRFCLRIERIKNKIKVIKVFINSEIDKVKKCH